MGWHKRPYPLPLENSMKYPQEIHEIQWTINKSVDQTSILRVSTKLKTTKYSVSFGRAEHFLILALKSGLKQKIIQVKAIKYFPVTLIVFKFGQIGEI